ncbi:MAG TPA: hypothetical protein VFS88_08725 [Micavibrio sp.]|nr:hypothetical protein [Micavibrio sp.]
MSDKDEDEDLPPPPPVEQRPKSDQDIEDILNAPPDKDLLPGRVRYTRDMSLDDLLTEEISTLTDEDRKKLKQIGYGALAVAVVITLLTIFSMQPKKGPMSYGICSTFLEMQTPYPNTLNYSGIEGSRTALRIYFTSIDPFGEYKLEMIECTFGPDDAGGMKLTQVTRNRRPVDAAIVDKFNKTLPIIMASDPYLVIPPDWKNPWLMDRKP